MIGNTLAHYEIIGLLGKGGMGEVFRARDTKLDREVAVKLLPREVSDNEERLARFRREAKLLATLNHPAIGALYGIEETDDYVFLVMELVEGEDLSHRLQRGSLPLDDALAVGLQIAEALEAAHAKAIVHRDLKPANVMCSQTGRVKLLDFGLARAFHDEDPAGDPMLSPTITAAMTQQGTILGTAAYMSPEQARGKSVDRQSDIWAFGVVLFEMLTGLRLFQGETVSDSIGAILHKDPEWARLPADTPPQVRQLLARCLARDCDERLHDIADARAAILDARRDPEGSRLGLTGITAPAKRTRTGLFAGLAVIAAVVVGLAAGPRLFPVGGPEPYRIYDLGVDLDPSNAQNTGIQAAVSPDGRAVVFTHEGRLWVQNLDAHLPFEVAQTEDAMAPFWSPDGSHLGWFQGNRLLKAPVAGGRPVALCEIKGRIAGGVGAHWGDQGRILFTTGSSGIQTVSERGGQPSELVPAGEGYGDLHEPFSLPGGNGVLFVSHPDERGPSVLEFWRDGERRVLFEAATGSRIWSPCYDPAGYVLFRLTRSDATEGLWAMDFDSGSGVVRGEPFLVEPDASEATIDRDGALVFVLNPHRSSERVVVRVGFDGTRHETLTAAHSGNLEFALSPDGRKLAFIALPPDGGTMNQVWVRDLERGTELQLTQFDDRLAFEIGWSPDSENIHFISPILPGGKAELLTMPADGSRPWTVLAEEPGKLTPDGESILILTGPRNEPITADNPDTTEIWLQRLGEPETRRLVLGGDGAYFPVAVSPGGQSLLYYSGRGGTDSVYLTRFPEFTGRWKVSLGNDVRAEAFAPDGSAIYYVGGRDLYRVAFTEGPTPQLGRPEQVGTLPEGALGGILIHPDGTSYLTVVDAQSQGGADRRRAVKVVRNWTAKLDRH